MTTGVAFFLGILGCARLPVADMDGPLRHVLNFETGDISVIECDLKVLNVGRKVTAELTITNPFERRIVWLHRDELPIGGVVQNEVFQIANGEKRVSYQCAFLDGYELVAEDLFSLNPGETKSFTYRIDKCYFMKEPGKYRIQYRTGLLDPQQLEEEELKDVEWTITKLEERSRSRKNEISENGVYSNIVEFIVP